MEPDFDKLTASINFPCFHNKFARWIFNSCVAGLPIPWKVTSLPVDLDTPRGSTRDALKQARHVVVDVVHAALGHIRVNGGEPEPLLPTGAGTPGVPLPLTTGPLFITNVSPHAKTLEWEISGDSTLPFHLAGCSPDIDTGKGGG